MHLQRLLRQPLKIGECGQMQPYLWESLAEGEMDGEDPGVYCASKDAA